MNSSSCSSSSSSVVIVVLVVVVLVVVQSSSCIDGLRLIHKKGIFHRNIKGQNIFRNSPPGSGRVIVKITNFRNVPYISPQMIMGETSENVNADDKCWNHFPLARITQASIQIDQLTDSY
ncbi:MAG: hypothetical protein EZS28_004119 [Streblomastix strix]|uniref:Protein kinase domain-containing protein n=1 Tax=Streblomastix strix TaxID=222440 RepID=A0A5J4WZN2_9EUKA|nr:MAG: hypothetical protein EZS28_004119 [Streblomastix strix]